MKKRRAYCTVSLVCYVLLALAATTLGIVCRVRLNALNSAPQEGLEGLAGIGYGIMMVLAFAYALLSLLPILFKILHTFLGKNVFGIVCIPFDIAYIGVHVAILYSAISGQSTGAIGTLLLLLAAFLLSVLSLLANILALREHIET